MEAELVRVPTGSGWHPQVGNGGELKKRTVYRRVRRVKRSQYGMVQHRRAGISREPLPPWPEGAQRGMVLGTKDLLQLWRGPPGRDPKPAPPPNRAQTEGRNTPRSSALPGCVSASHWPHPSWRQTVEEAPSTEEASKRQSNYIHEIISGSHVKKKTKGGKNLENGAVMFCTRCLGKAILGQCHLWRDVEESP